MFIRRERASEPERMLDEEEVRQLERARRALLHGMLFFLGCILIGMTRLERWIPAEHWGLELVRAGVLIYIVFPVLVAAALSRWVDRKQALTVFVVLLPTITLAEAIAAHFDRIEILPAEWWKVLLPLNLILSAFATAIIYFFDAVGRIERHREEELDEVEDANECQF